jgi:hypothetical protein
MTSTGTPTRLFARIALVCFASLVLIAAPGCEDKVTLENYDQITTGMDMGAVESILGGSGEIQQASGVGIGASGMLERQGGGGDTKEYLWGNENRGILVKFKDGQVVHKQKFGL